MKLKNIFSNTHFGFRKGSGVIDRLGTIITDVRVAFDNNEPITAALLDIVSVYHNVQLPILNQTIFRK